MSVVPFSAAVNDSTLHHLAALGNYVLPFAKKVAKIFPAEANKPTLLGTTKMFNMPFIPRKGYKKRTAGKAGKRVIKAEKKVVKAVVKAEKKVVARAMQGVNRQLVGNLPRTKFAFSKASGKFAKNRPGAVTFVGHEFVANISSSLASAVQGSLMRTVTINPLTLGSKRLKTFSAFFEKYRFEDLKIKWIPGVGTTVNGSARAAWDLDSADVLGPSAAQNFISVLSQPGSKSAEYFNQQTWVMPKSNSGTSGDNGFYTNITSGSDVRLVNQGTWNLLVENPAAATAGSLPTTLGSLVVYYRCTFWNPVTEGNEITSDFQAFYAQAGGGSLALPWGTLGSGNVPVQESNSGGSEVVISSTSGSTTTLTWSSQVQAMLVIAFVGTATTAPTVSFSGSTNITTLIGGGSGQAYLDQNMGNGTTVNGTWRLCQTTTIGGPNCVQPITCAGGAGAVLSGSTYIVCIPFQIPTLTFKAHLGQETRLRQLLGEFNRLARSMGVSLSDEDIKKTVLSSPKLLDPPAEEKSTEEEKEQQPGKALVVREDFIKVEETMYVPEIGRASCRERV